MRKVFTWQMELTVLEEDVREWLYPTLDFDPELMFTNRMVETDVYDFLEHLEEQQHIAQIPDEIFEEVFKFTCELFKKVLIERDRYYE